MKLATYSSAGGHGIGIGVVSEDGRGLQPLSGESAKSLLGLIQQNIMPSELASLAAGPTLFLADLTLKAPIPRPIRNVFCVGKNYYEHAHEFAGSGFDSSAAAGVVPDAPIIFSKVPESVIATNEAICFDPGISEAIDYEGELAVIIGKSGRQISKDRALEHVWGYTIINDVTARDWQGRHKQWLLGKSFSTFCPMGPWAVTADEIDLADTTLQTWINGELRQDANTRDLIFDVLTLIKTISTAVPLLPGDIISTGTPAGVGIGFKPPKYLKDGDVVRIEIGGIGVLENPVKTESIAG